MANTKKTTKPAAKRTTKKTTTKKSGISQVDKNSIWLAFIICIVGILLIFFYLFHTSLS